MSEFVIPKELNYHETIPLDYGSTQNTVVVTPLTGNVSYSGINQDTIIFQIPRGGANTVFDGKTSFFRFRFANTGVNTTFFKSTADAIIGRLEVRHGANTLEIVNNYEGLVSALIDCSVNQSDRASSWAITNGTSLTSGSLLGANFAAQNAVQYFSLPLVSGVVGTLSRSYLAIYDLTGNIEVRIQWNIPAKVLATYGAGVTAAVLYVVDQCEFHCNFITLGQPILDQIKTPVYDIHTEMYSQFGSNVAAAATVVEQVVPVRVTSLKSILVVP